MLSPGAINLARSLPKDAAEFLALATQIPIKPEFQEDVLKEANQALMELKSKKIRRAKLLRIT